MPYSGVAVFIESGSLSCGSPGTKTLVLWPHDIVSLALVNARYLVPVADAGALCSRLTQSRRLW